MKLRHQKRPADFFFWGIILPFLAVVLFFAINEIRLELEHSKKMTEILEEELKIRQELRRLKNDELLIEIMRSQRCKHCIDT